MNSNLSFLLIVLVISVVGSVYLWLRSLRSRRPRTFMSSIEEFQREMNALAHDPLDEPPRRRRPTPPKPIVPSRPKAGLADQLRAARARAGQGDPSRR